MTVKEQREILEAYERGEEIEFKFVGDICFSYTVSKEVQGENYEFDFNSREYRIKRNRWRAQEGEEYFYIFSCGEIDWATEIGADFDNCRYEYGNYFRTQEEARSAVDYLRECLTKFHESN